MATISSETSTQSPVAAHSEQRRRIRTAVAICLGVAPFGILFAVLVVLAIQNGIKANQKHTCNSNLRQIAYALNKYEEEHGRFPPAYTVDDSGQRLHSWRSLILPYLGRKDIFDQIDFTQPWDSPANRRFLELQLNCFACPSDLSETGGLTSYLAIDDPQSVFRGTKRVTSQYVSARDGSMFTVFVMEVAGSDVHWLEPRDLALADLEQAFQCTGKAISSRHEAGAHVAFVSGRVNFISKEIERDVLRAIMTCDGRDYVGWSYMCCGARRVERPSDRTNQASKEFQRSSENAPIPNGSQSATSTGQ